MSLTGTVWAPIGPSPMNEGGGGDNGLVTSIEVHPNNPSVLYLGTAQGGVWRSGDGGNNWTPLFDRQFSLGIGEGALAIDPNNTSIIFAGTSGRVGSAEPDTISQPSAGLFKSTDGGASWIALGSGFPTGNTGNATQFRGRAINVVIVDPANSSVVYLASFDGVFISSDSGQNWTAANGLASDTRSLVLDLSSPVAARILHAGVSGRGVFTSRNGGRSFTQVLSASTPAVAGVLAGGGFGRVIVALAPPTTPPNANGAQVLYVTMSGSGSAPDPLGLFISSDQGGTWTQQAATGVTGTTYGGYALAMAVDPASPGDGSNDTIYFGCLAQYRSIDSGANFTGLSVGHADTHAWALVPQSGGAASVVYCGTDGGLFVSTNGGTSWTSRNGGGLQTGLFYNIAVKPDATASVTAGALQDNQLQTTAGGPPGLSWNATFGGDGWDISYDGGTPPVLYGTSGGPASVVSASTDDGLNFPTNLTPPWTAADTGGFLLTQITADPSASGVLYVSGLQNLWQRQSGSWRIIASPGTSGNVDVAPSNGNNVVIAAGTQVLASTNALAPTLGPPSGVTFANITRNLPGRNVARAVFDPVDPTVIYAVLTGFSGAAAQNVFKTTVGGTGWANISPPVDVPCGAIAVDGTTTPTTLYVGTDLGVLRSTNAGVSWSVLDDLHFPRAPVFDLGFNWRAGVLRAATYGRGVFEFKKPAGPAIAVDLENGLFFGSICSGPSFLRITVYNVGGADLVISNVQVLFGSSDFFVLSTPATPVTVEPGEEITFTVAYTATVSAAVAAALIRITSNDLGAPFVDLLAFGGKGRGKLATAIADFGDFGSVCVGTLADKPLMLNNTGPCPLRVFGIASSAADFQAPSVFSYPLVIASGGGAEVPIRFRPGSFGPHSATITISSDDPASPASILVSGTAPAPRVALALANTGNFGRCCVGVFVDEQLTIANSGGCTLSVTAITSTSAAFLPPEILAFPLTIEAGNAIGVPMRFQPTALGVESGTIEVVSDDPASPARIAVTGFAPPGKLAVTGSTSFGGVTACCCADRTISICNVGDCKLEVSSVAFKRKSSHWKLLNNPFPAILQPGSCLSLTVRYKATEKCSRCSELVITSDDPAVPVKTLELLAYTIWNECGCEKCCDDCRKGRCEKNHSERCSQGYPCCDDDELDDS